MSYTDMHTHLAMKPHFLWKGALQLGPARRLREYATIEGKVFIVVLSSTFFVYAST